MFRKLMPAAALTAALLNPACSTKPKHVVNTGSEAIDLMNDYINQNPANVTFNQTLQTIKKLGVEPVAASQELITDMRNRGYLLLNRKEEKVLDHVLKEIEKKMKLPAISVMEIQSDKNMRYAVYNTAIDSANFPAMPKRPTLIGVTKMFMNDLHSGKVSPEHAEFLLAHELGHMLTAKLPKQVLDVSPQEVLNTEASYVMQKEHMADIVAGCVSNDKGQEDFFMGLENYNPNETRSLVGLFPSSTKQEVVGSPPIKTRRLILKRNAASLGSNCSVR